MALKYSKSMPQTGTIRKHTLDLQQHAEEIFGDAEIAQRWLQHPNRATDGKPPMALLASENGYARVKTLLDRIDYGVLA
jgi:uncharacterized protein (DUF2384 family)